MALIGRYSVLSKHPGRGIGGSGTGEGMNPGDFSKNSRFRARFTSEDWASISGVPFGYRPPAAWILPQSPGALSSYTTIVGTGTLAAAAAAGKNAVAALTGSGDLGLREGGAPIAAHGFRDAAARAMPAVVFIFTTQKQIPNHPLLARCLT